MNNMDLLLQRVMELERKVNFLLQEFGLEEKYRLYRSSYPEMEDVQALVREGRLIQAIKLYREKTGVGLAEAKVAVEQMKGY